MAEAAQTPSEDTLAAAATLWSPVAPDAEDVTLSIKSNPIETQQVQVSRANLSVRHLEEPGPGPADHGVHPDTDFKLGAPGVPGPGHRHQDDPARRRQPGERGR